MTEINSKVGGITANNTEKTTLTDYDFKEFPHKDLLQKFVKSYLPDLYLFLLLGTAKDTVEIIKTPFEVQRRKHSFYKTIDRLSKPKFGLCVFPKISKHIHEIHPEEVKLTAYGKKVLQDWEKSGFLDELKKVSTEELRTPEQFIAYFFNKFPLFCSNHDLLSRDNKSTNKNKEIITNSEEYQFTCTSNNNHELKLLLGYAGKEANKKISSVEYIVFCSFCCQKTIFTVVPDLYIKYVKTNQPYQKPCEYCKFPDPHTRFIINFKSKSFFSERYFLESDLKRLTKSKDAVVKTVTKRLFVEIDKCSILEQSQDKLKANEARLIREKLKLLSKIENLEERIKRLEFSSVDYKEFEYRNNQYTNELMNQKNKEIIEYTRARRVYMEKAEKLQKFRIDAEIQKKELDKKELELSEKEKRTIELLHLLKLKQKALRKDRKSVRRERKAPVEPLSITPQKNKEQAEKEQAEINRSHWLYLMESLKKIYLKSVKGINMWYTSGQLYLCLKIEKEQGNLPYSETILKQAISTLLSMVFFYSDKNKSRIYLTKYYGKEFDYFWQKITNQ